MEDAIALFRAFDALGYDVPAAFAAFEAARRPIVEKILAAARNSYIWYENFGADMGLTAYEFAYAYMTRSGRMSKDRLRSIAPRFMADYDGHQASKATPSG